MAKLGPYELNTIVTGDARVLAEAIPDSSVDLIFTDPVYQNIEDYEWLAQTAARVLKPDRACLVWCGIGYLPDELEALSKNLTFKWQFIEYRTNEVKHRHAPGGKCLYSPLLWFNKGHFRPKFVLDVRAISVFTSSSNHYWSKPPLTISYYLNAFTHPGDIVADFFCGGGTVPAVAKMLGVNYWACEIDPITATRARARVLLTQPPLFVMPAQQLELA